MRKLIELAELPLGKGRVSTASDCGGVLVIFLEAVTVSLKNGCTAEDPDAYLEIAKE